MNKILLGIVGVVVLVGGFLLLSGQNKNTSSVTVSPVATATPAPTATNSANTVTLTATGFNPDTLTVKVGTTVTWVNKSGEEATVNSDPHPTHTLWPFLNLGSFSDGGSLNVTFDKAGTYTYHNHLNPSERGTIVVE